MGSEMCIRDRHTSSSTPAISNTHTAAQHGRPQAGAQTNDTHHSAHMVDRPEPAPAGQPENLPTRADQQQTRHKQDNDRHDQAQAADNTKRATEPAPPVSSPAHGTKSPSHSTSPTEAASQRSIPLHSPSRRHSNICLSPTRPWIQADGTAEPLRALGLPHEGRRETTQASSESPTSTDNSTRATRSRAHITSELEPMHPQLTPARPPHRRLT